MNGAIVCPQTASQFRCLRAPAKDGPLMRGDVQLAYANQLSLQRLQIADVLHYNQLSRAVTFDLNDVLRILRGRKGVRRCDHCH